MHDARRFRHRSPPRVGQCRSSAGSVFSGAFTRWNAPPSLLRGLADGNQGRRSIYLWLSQRHAIDSSPQSAAKSHFKPMAAAKPFSGILGVRCAARRDRRVDVLRHAPLNKHARSTDGVIDRKRRKSDNHHYCLAQSQRLSSLSVGQDRRGYKQERYRRLRFGCQPRHARRSHRQRFSEQITPRLQTPKLSAGNGAGATARRRRKPILASPSVGQSRRRHRGMLARQKLFRPVQKSTRRRRLPARAGVKRGRRRVHTTDRAAGRPRPWR